jgi:hypothetical protein
MKLTQKKFLSPTFQFELKEGILTVTTKAITSSNGFEVPVRELSNSVSYHRYFPLGWVIFSALMLLGAMSFTVGCFIDGSEDAKIAFVFFVLLFGTVGLMCAAESFKRNVDYVILHWSKSGSQAVYFRRKIPSERHVQEYIDILKDKISEQNKNEEERA